MIVVDTSVWIAHFRNEPSASVATLRALDPNDIVVSDLILLECLQGARDDKHAARIEAALGAFKIEAALDGTIAVRSAQHYRTLRTAGVTPRSTIDVMIATFCIHHSYRLLHQDRDFDAMAAHIALHVIATT